MGKIAAAPEGTVLARVVRVAEHGLVVFSVQLNQFARPVRVETAGSMFAWGTLFVTPGLPEVANVSPEKFHL